MKPKATTVKQNEPFRKRVFLNILVRLLPNLRFLFLRFCMTLKLGHFGLGKTERKVFGFLNVAFLLVKVKCRYSRLLLRVHGYFDDL